MSRRFFSSDRHFSKPLSSKQKKRNETRETVAQLLVSWGYDKDSYGNYKKDMDGKKYRYKFEDNVLRYEIKIGTRWSLIKSGYWKNLVIGINEITGWKE